MAELSECPVPRELMERPRGGFNFDLYNRDVKLGKAMAGLSGTKMPAAMKTG